jgi:phosphopantothenoylcysteine decarboxylase
LALRLAQELHAHVVVLLTNGGENFWYKAKDYDQNAWERYCNFVGDAGAGAGAGSGATDDSDADGRQQRGQQNDENINSMLLQKDFSDDGKGCIGLFHAQDEWNGWNKIGDPVLHIQLRDWADLVIIAPLSAHTLAKISNGLCDDTLSCVLRAWDYGQILTRSCKPVILAPAMNTAMWEHPLTQRQLHVIMDFEKDDKTGSSTDGFTTNAANTSSNNGCLRQIRVVDPQVKMLACGEVGAGAMADISDIINAAQSCLEALN